MTIEDREEFILRTAISQYGKEAQLRMAQEECGELIVAISHYQRARGTINDLIEEIADVEIMLGQLKIIFNKYDILEKKNEKLLKLESNLKLFFSCGICEFTTNDVESFEKHDCVKVTS